MIHPKALSLHVIQCVLSLVKNESVRCHSSPRIMIGRFVFVPSFLYNQISRGAEKATAACSLAPVEVTTEVGALGAW